MTRLLRNIGQLATCPPDNPQHDAGLIPNAALLIQDGRVSWAGPETDVPELPEHCPTIDCAGQLVIPGLIDCHTHLCFGGWRGDEFALRVAGATYQEIAAAGGGIRRTVEDTRAADTGTLLDKARVALDGMLALGVTTVECKSGYGLDRVNELRQLEIYQQLNAGHAVELVPTFLGAHVVPEEHAGDRQTWLDILCDELLPTIAERKLAKFCDVFVEQGAYSVAEARRILSQAKALGLGLKIHADQLSDSDGALLAAELGAVSAEHLEYANTAGIEAMAKAGTVAVSLPLASLYLQEPFIRARQLIAAGARVAVATDFNPGSAPSYHLPLAMMLACTQQGMSPEESLMGATSIAARALALESDRGSLLSGYRADCAIIEAPTVNHWLYHFTANACTQVLKNGEVVRSSQPMEHFTSA